MLIALSIRIKQWISILAIAVGLFCILGLRIVAFASESIGTIDPSSAGFTQTKICHDETCTTYGNINWKPTINANTPGASAVTITDSGVTGHLWGDETGWADMNPTGAGVTVNASTGALSGYAYAHTGSWINFNPTGGGVTLVDNGSGSNFSGTAWVSGLYGGWMTFDCSDATTCVKTDWRTTSNRSSGGGGGSSSGGGGSILGLLGSIFNPFASAPTSVPPQTSAVLPTSPDEPIIDRITDTVTDIIDKLPFFGEDKEEKSLLTDEDLDESLVFNNVWSLLDAGQLTDFTLAPLPNAIINLAIKFPAFRASLEGLHINTLKDFDQLKGVTFKLPTLADLADIPSEIIFAHSGNNLIDFVMGLSVEDDNTVQQTIRTVSGQTVELAVKPEHEAERVRGFLVLKQGGKPTLNLPLNFQLASALFADSNAPGKSADVEDINTELLLLTFDYTDTNNDGVYTANIVAPLVSSTYEVITVIDYANKAHGSKELHFVLLVDPEGYVYEKAGGKEARIPEATVTIFVKNTNTESFVSWDATKFSQTNPQVTNATGEYSFLVPPGEYYISVQAKGYKDFTSDVFSVTEGRGVHQNMELVSTNLWRRFNSPWLLIGIALLFFLANHFYRDYKKRY